MIHYFYSSFILFSICYGILFMLQLYFKGPKDPNSPLLKWAFACMHVQSCLTLCNPMDCSPPGSSVHGIFPGQEYSRGLPCPPPGYLPDPEIERGCPPLPADSLPSELLGKPWNIYMYVCVCIYIYIFFFFWEAALDWTVSAPEIICWFWYLGPQKVTVLGDGALRK